MASVTRWPRSQYSDLLWLINSAATACHWPINQDVSAPPHHTTPPPPPPLPRLTLLHLSAHLNMRWRLDGFHRISLWENTAWQNCLHVWEFWLRNMHSSPVPADVTTPLSPKSEVFSLVFSSLSHHLVERGGFYKSIWIFASNVDTHCLNRLFTKLPGKQGGWKWKARQCLLQFDDENKRENDRKYQALTIPAHLS